MPSLLLERILIAAISALASATATLSFIKWRLRRQKKVIVLLLDATPWPDRQGIIRGSPVSSASRS